MERTARRRRRSEVVALGVTAVMAASSLTACGSGDEEDEPAYAGVCADEQTGLRLEDEQCRCVDAESNEWRDDDDCRQHRTRSHASWYFIPYGLVAAGIGQRVVGGRFGRPPQDRSYRAGRRGHRWWPDLLQLGQGRHHDQPGWLRLPRRRQRWVSRVRHTACDPRPNWRDRVSSQGLVFYDAPSGAGGGSPYWTEDACYRLTSAEVDYLEVVTEQLHQMCVEAGRFLASGAMGSLGLPPGALEIARASLEAGAPSLYGRFDLAWDGRGHAKLLEYNADTPTGLLEASVIQWYWLQDTHPELDQWNSLHERLVQAWRELAWRLPQAPVVFAHHPGSEGAEEEMTVTYLRDTADQAGLRTSTLPIDRIGYDEERRCFVDEGSDVLRTCFKLYPWEDMLAERFGRYVEPVPSGPRSTTWLEPPWKVLLSNKALLAALWQLYPGHDCLLPAYLDGPGDLVDWVAKPLHGREGEGIRAQVGGVTLGAGAGGAPVSSRYGAEGYCYQQWWPLPSFDGNRPVLGSWVVDGRAAGLGIREGTQDITDHLARFVPHLIEAPRPDEATQAAWLTEPATPIPAREQPTPTSLPTRPAGAPAPPAGPQQGEPVVPQWRPFRVEPAYDDPTRPADVPPRDAPRDGPRDGPQDYPNDPTRGIF